MSQLFVLHSSLFIFSKEMRSLATDLLWKIVNGEEIERGGKTHVASLRESLTAISLLGRMEGWFLKSEEKKVKNEEGKEALMHDDTPCGRGKVREQAELQFAQPEFAPQPTQSQPTLPEQTQYITPATQQPLLLEEKPLAFNLLTFTQKTLPYFKPAPFHRTYYEKLTDFALGRIQKLMITMPPQHGKSEGATRRLPAFVLGCNPNKRIAIVSYNATKARKFNRELQRIMDEDTYHELFPQATLARSPSSHPARKSRSYARNADECEIVGYQGSFKTIGVGGSLTGEPVDILIMDDLYKDAAAAWSPLIRQNIADWYDTVASTRLHNSSQQLLVFTRWHEDDLAGRLLQKEDLYHPTDNPHGWVLLSFPAIKDSPPTPLDPRAQGEVLWPERHNLEKLLQIKQRNGAVFESLYQQNPQPSQGLMYEEFQCYTEIPSRTYSVAYIDAADSGADYLCALFYKEAQEGNFLVDVLYTKDPMKVTEMEIAHKLLEHQVERCHIESNNGGGLFAHNLEERAQQMGNNFTRFYPFHQSQNKIARIFSASSSVQQLVHMPLDWKKRFPTFARDLMGYLKEGTNPHDDAPDALTGSVECRQPPRKIPLSELLQW